MYETLHTGEWGGAPVAAQGKYDIIPFLFALLSSLYCTSMRPDKSIFKPESLASISVLPRKSMTNIKQKQNHKHQIEKQRNTGTVTQTQTISQSHRNAVMGHALSPNKEKRQWRWIRDYESEAISKRIGWEPHVHVSLPQYDQTLINEVRVKCLVGTPYKIGRGLELNWRVILAGANCFHCFDGASCA